MDHAAPSDSLPPLKRDRAFWGMTAAQFLGAFNDNVYKQLVLLVCVGIVADASVAGGERQFDQQAIATFLFAVPFLLFSGFAGFLADRFSKRTIVVLCKLAEVGIAGLGVLAFFAFSQQWFGAPDTLSAKAPVLMVLFLLGCHSAYFGPPKYGILPEMLRGRDLPQANGIFQMTTFFAIILGTALAGVIKDAVPDRLWLGSTTCLFVAGFGVVAALQLRCAPPAQPQLKLDAESLFIGGETRDLLRRERPLLHALVASSLFWMAAAVVLQAINALGKLHFRLTDSQTSLLVALTNVGIGLGFLAAGTLSRGRVAFRLVPIGAWGITITLLLVALPGLLSQIPADAPRGWASLPTLAKAAVVASSWALMGVGFFTGLYCLPLQVFMQTKPPAYLKGRVIGAMNFCNWVGITLGSVYYGLWGKILDAVNLPMSAMFAATALIVLPVAILYRPDRATDDNVHPTPPLCEPTTTR